MCRRATCVERAEFCVERAAFGVRRGASPLRHGVPGVLGGVLWRRPRAAKPKACHPRADDVTAISFLTRF